MCYLINDAGKTGQLGRRRIIHIHILTQTLKCTSKILFSFTSLQSFTNINVNKQKLLKTKRIKGKKPLQI